MKRRFIGIDIKPQIMAVVVASQSHKGFWIDAVRHLPLAGEAGIPSQLEPFLNDYLPPPGERENVWAAISLPASQMAFRNLQVPFKEPKKIRQILPFELEPSLSEGIEGLVVDFYPIQLGNAHHVLTATIGKSLLQAYKYDLAEVGLSPQLISVDGYILAQQINKTSHGEEDSILIAVDGRVVTLVISASHQVVSVRAFTLPSSLSSALAFSCANVRQTLSAFREEWLPDYNPRTVFLSSTSAAIFAQSDTIARNLRLPVKPLASDQIFSIAGASPAGEGWPEHIYANALALISFQGRGEGINFRQDTLTLAKFMDDNRRPLIKAGAIGLIVFLLALFILLYETRNLQQTADRYDQEIRQMFRSSFPEVTTIVDPVQQMRVKIDEMEAQSRLPLEAGRGVRSIDLLNTLSEQIPKTTDVKITRLVVGTDGIMVTGNTDSFNSVDEIKGQLEQSSLIETVTTASANKEKRGTRIQFKLKLTLGEATGS